MNKELHFSEGMFCVLSKGRNTILNNEKNTKNEIQKESLISFEI